jgi:Flp pilus assembly protein CpaB
MVHHSPRAVLLWGAAAIVALATAVIVASDLAALHRHAHELGPERTAIVARHDLPVGSIIRDDDVRERRIHESQLPSGAVDALNRASGRVVRVAVLRDGIVGVRNLASRRRTGLDGSIPRGMRAIRVVVADALRPRRGAAVDLIASYQDSGNAGAATDAVATATVVAEGVLVLETDGARTAEGAAALGLTVLVTAHQANDLAYASTHGVLTLALVPPEESRGP